MYPIFTDEMIFYGGVIVGFALGLLFVWVLSKFQEDE